jgi:hypothetical protein
MDILYGEQGADDDVVPNVGLLSGVPISRFA